MYRLLKAKGDQLQKFQNLLSCRRKVEVEGLCSSCHKLQLFGNGFSRLQSTRASANFKALQKRKPRTKTNRYAELLVVGDKSLAEQKARVQKLNPKDLKIFMTTNFDLSEFYKLKSFSKNPIVDEHTYNNLRVIENIPTVIDSDISETRPENIIDEAEDVLDVLVPSGRLHLSTFQEENLEEDDPEFVENEEKIISIEKQPLEIMARREILSRTLSAYIEVCNNLKSPQRGLNAFHFIRLQRFKNKLVGLKDVRVYNTLLKGFAAKAVLQKMEEIIRYADEDNVQLNAQSYACVFECLGRINNDNCHSRNIRVFTQRALNEGFSYNRILNEAILDSEQRNYVLASMRSHDTRFEPKYKAPNLFYNNSLVNHLNSDEKILNRNNLSKSGVFKDIQWDKVIEEQMQIEKDGIVTVKSVEIREKPSEEVRQFRKTFNEHIRKWEEDAQAAFHRDLAALMAQRSPLNMEPYMRSIPVKEFVKIIVDEATKIAQGSESYSPTVNLLYKDLGHKVYAKYKVLRKQKTGTLDKICDVHSEYCEEYGLRHPELGVIPDEENMSNPRKSWQMLEYAQKGTGASITLDHQNWVPTVLQNIGKFLYHIVMYDLKINVNCMHPKSKHKNYLPAFYSLFRNQGRLVKEEVKPHPILCRLYRASKPETLTFPAYEVPMLCPPIPWVSIHCGGYLVAPCEIVRLPWQAVAQKHRLKEANVRDLYPSFDSLNQLAAVPWMVNKKILDIILQVFASGGSSKLDVPEPPSSLPPLPSVSMDMEKGERYQIFRQKLQQRRKKAEMYSLWCDCLYRLSLTNHFRDKIFWLPHNMDFRGRVYPVPPHLNHLGSDLARSTLVFAEARPLGKSGLDWLKLHLVNLTGLKKRDSIQDRLNFANLMMEEILDSADNPLTGRKWWTESDEPWQTLACCIEIAEASRSPDPESFLSHFPVHQDGSCNGLQHYAALGRDSAGAHSVNLTPSIVPQDVYSAVAALVEKQRRADAERGLEVAKVLDGFVRRKVIKQTVMTTVYGVTRFGARLQIARQLKDIEEFPKEFVWAASSYLTGRTFDSLRSMFTSTREIQDWFTDCARLISSVGEQNVEWVTPMGLPIVQPYFRYKKPLPGAVENFCIDKYEKPNTMKQKNAFPPNFIHSLDSCHMILTSLHCERAGITFVSVHDCYWTHPSTVHIMNKICREQFVALHSEPILENLSVFLTEKYSYSESEFVGDGSIGEVTKKKLNKVLRQLPKTGKFDISEVLKSVFFFS